MEARIYPIGKAPYGQIFAPAETADHLIRIQQFPKKLKDACSNLSPEDLIKTYREGGWMVAQIIHHISDSHLNAFIRTKLTLTEDEPIIKPYDENAWALTPDSMPSFDVKVSINLIEALHSRWSNLLENVKLTDWERKYFHPEKKLKISLRSMVGLYAWHGDHHLEQIKLALKS